MSTPPASIVIPTRARGAYLQVALASIVPQARDAQADVLVVDDGGDTPAVRALAEASGARYEPHPRPLGLNAARNTGVRRSEGELVVFVDDDVRASSGWLEALMAAARANLAIDVFTGPIRPSLEGAAPRTCGREAPPITTLELGSQDTGARYAWGANMAIRRSALQRVGEFDVSLHDGGDEQEWQDRLRAREPDASVLYVARAAVEHRRAGADARLASLARTAHRRGRAARRFDARRGQAPSLARELTTLAACVAHVVIRRCPAGLTMVAHSAGRLREGLRERRAQDAGGDHRSAVASPARGLAAQDAAGHTAAQGAAAHAAAHTEDDFLTGTSGTVGGLDARRRELADSALDAWELASGRRLQLAFAAREHPPLRRVLALGVVRAQRRSYARAIEAELLRSRHDVQLHTCPPEGRGKFENLNRLLREHPVHEIDWLVVVDDDVELPHGFLDRFLFLCERFGLQLAQPAHRLCSHAAWPQTRRRAGSVVREGCFVEIGPVTAFARVTLDTLLPFPDGLGMGWGLDVHWAALAREHGWRCGVVDAVCINHRAAPAASAYPRELAIAQARAFLAARPYLSAGEARRTLVTHRRW